MPPKLTPITRHVAQPEMIEEGRGIGGVVSLL